MRTYQEFDPVLGIASTVHELDGKRVFQKTYDAEPFLRVAAEDRAQTDGQRWGEMRKVGTIPMAELAKMMRQDGTIDRDRCMAWIKANPAFCSFTKALK
jgi:hypothetical protein